MVALEAKSLNSDNSILSALPEGRLARVRIRGKYVWQLVTYENGRRVRKIVKDRELLEALLKKHLNFNGRLLFVIVGGILYYIVVVIVLWFKLPTNDLKLFTAAVVALFLAVPYLREQSKSSFRAAAKKKGGDR